MTPGRLCMWQLLKVKQEIIVSVLMSYSGQCVCVSDVCVCVCFQDMPRWFASCWRPVKSTRFPKTGKTVTDTWTAWTNFESLIVILELSTCSLL